MEKEKNEKQTDIGVGKKICIWQNVEECENCNLDEVLFCHPKTKYLIYFAFPLFIGLIPLILIVIFALISLPFKLIFFISWAFYAMFFFNIWETRILCNHCPYFSNESQKVLHCPIDKGKYKAGTYDPGPLSLSEKIQFGVGGILLMIFPIPFLIIADLYLALFIYAISIVLWILSIQSNVCTDCVNFACPLNRVPKDIKNRFMEKNPVIKKAWEERGYKID
ncbi:MAG: hypothetical protein ACQERB_17610 [Promethearchaeati archaeon]